MGTKFDAEKEIVVPLNKDFRELSKSLKISNLMRIKDGGSIIFFLKNTKKTYCFCLDYRSNSRAKGQIFIGGYPNKKGRLLSSKDTNALEVLSLLRKGMFDKEDQGIYLSIKSYTDKKRGSP